MANYDSIHTGQEIDAAVDIVQGNVSKGDASTPVYFNASGVAVAVNKDATPTENSTNLVESGGVYTELSAKVPKTDIDTNVNLGTSNTKVPSQGAVKSYVDAGLATKQDIVSAGDGIVKEGNTLSINNDNDFMTSGKLDNKVNHIDNVLPYGTASEMVAKMEAAKRTTYCGDQPSDASPLDPKKFTTSGGWSGVITDDGIASGFSTSDYLTINDFISSSSNFVIKFEGTLPIAGDYNVNIFGRNYPNTGYSNIYLGRANQTNDLYFDVIVDVNGTPTSAGGAFVDMTGYAGAHYKGSVSFNGTQYLASFTFDDNVTKTIPINSTYLLANTGDLIIGFSRSGSTTFDLKQFSITVDGVEVFSGNKTGIDTIKPDDYTASNPANITADGVFDQSLGYGYITVNDIGIDVNKPFKIEFPFTKIASTSNGSYPVGYYENSFANCYMNDGGFVPKLVFDDNGTATTLSTTPSTLAVPNVGETVNFVIEYDGNQAYTISIIRQNGTILSGTITTALKLNSTKLFVGRAGYGLTTQYMKVDLDKLKAWSDGNLVYQPCLKIPYTLTKDNKKIVEYQYKDRVADEYNQAGFTPYYTLNTMDRANYTVVGSPTISSEWIASGFSSTDYVRLSVVDLRGKKWKIECDFTTGSDVTTGVQIPWSLSHFGYYNALGTYLSNGVLALNCNAGGTSVGHSYAVTANTHYHTSIEFTGSKYIFVVNDTTPEEIDNSNEVSNLDATTYLTAGININANGAIHTGVIGFKGSVDLNSFKLYVDNKLAYQAVIPPNYTLATVKESAIVDSYDNGMSKWTKYADLTLKQQGSCTSGTAVQFAKPFRDANYALSVPYTSGTKTKTGFTPSFTNNCDYIAIGKCNLTFPQE